MSPVRRGGLPFANLANRLLHRIIQVELDFCTQFTHVVADMREVVHQAGQRRHCMVDMPHTGGHIAVSDERARGQHNRGDGEDDQNREANFDALEGLESGRSGHGVQ